MSPKILNLAFLSLISLTPHVLAIIPSKDSSACYNSPGDLTLAFSSQFNSLGMCGQKCTNAVAAVQGTDCYCGSSLPPSSAKVSNDNCDIQCPGYPVDNCTLYKLLLCILATNRQLTRARTGGGSKAWTVIYDPGLLKENSENSTSTSLTVNPTLVATITKDTANPTATIPAEILTAPSATFTQHPGVATHLSPGIASSSLVVAASSAGASSASASASSSTPSASPSGSAGAAATLSRSVGAAGSIVGMVFLPLVMSWF
jgi:cell wall integrity and stress response component